MSKRDVNPIIQKFRQFLLGRKHTHGVRFQDEMSARTQCPPCLPDGPSGKLSKNFYWKRNARGSVAPPIDLLKGQSVKALAGPVEEPKPISAPAPVKDDAIKKSKKRGRPCSLADEVRLNADSEQQGSSKGTPSATTFRSPGKVFGWDQIHRD